jgi:hypothetical protein
LKYNPNISGSITLLENIAYESIDKIDNFEPQSIANVVWAYASLKVSNPHLFEVVGDSIVGSDKMKLFKPQDFANILWSYATLNVQHHAMFKKIGDHIQDLNDLSSFNPQNIANIVWAYAKARVEHTNLFKKVGDHIVMLDSLKSFNPQNLSNIAWAYATANELRTDLFESIGASTCSFERGHLDSFNTQSVLNIAWSFAVADVDIPLFREGDFAKALLDRKRDFNTASLLRQLYQWHIWQKYEKSNAGLPEKLVEICHNAFINSGFKYSSFQKSVHLELVSMGLNPVEEYITPSGYKIDALVQINDTKVGVEVYGQSRFIDKKLTGRTLLKRRQITAIDKIPLVYVPYWEWNELDDDTIRQQQYLQKILRLNCTPLEKRNTLSQFDII